MRSYLVAVLLLATSLPMSGQASAQLTDPLASTTDPADRAVMAEAASAVSGRPPEIARLDAVLAKLPRPTPLRGMVQAIRAGVLASTRDAGPAAAAVEEAMRLLPDDPRPKMVATAIYTFAGSPQRAADLWMQASRESPDVARMSDRYVMMALVGRLKDIGDVARADRVGSRLGEIGFSAGLAPERSAAALARAREAARSQGASEAALSVTAISDPNDLLSLYVDRRYEAIWPRISEWAGPDLSGQSLRYLQELRGDWTAANDFLTAVPYARRLTNLKAYDAVIALFLPMIEHAQPGIEQPGIELLAPIVARVLAQLGRGVEARALLAKVAAGLPAATGGNSLNIDAAYVSLATRDVDWPEVIARADAFLAQARELGSAVNLSATLEVQAWRACALSRSGRDAEAQRAAAEVLLSEATLPSPALTLHLCMGSVGAARALVIRRLGDDKTRSWGLAVVQPVEDDASSPLARLVEPTGRAMRTAPDVVAAANRVGRILPRPLSAELPTGFDPFRAQPLDKPLGREAT